jgi:iron complex outermembrane receptor protein
MTGHGGRGRTLTAILMGAAALGALATAAQAQAPVSTAPTAGSQAPCAPGQTAGCVAAPAGATPATAAPPAASTVQEVVVTGSLFRRPNFDTPSPVTQLTAADIAKEGITNVSDAIRSVSADNSGTIPNAFSNGFAAGASGVSLRGLTAADTLVLIDGLRTADYPVADDGVRSFVDLNTIPIGALQEVQVDKNGASALYGSDAVAGVVNIIMKKQFQGFEGDASYGDSQHGGGKSVHAYGLFGVGDLGSQGWNAYVDVEYQNDGAITAGQRDFPYNTTNLASIGGNNLIGGQPGLNSGSIYGSVTPGTLGTPGNLLSGVPNPGATSQILSPTGCGARTTKRTDANGNVYCAQNFVPYADDQPADERWGIYGHFTKNFGQDNQFFMNVYYYDNKINVYNSPLQIQSSAPINTNGIALPPTLSNGALNPNNPFAASGQYALLNYAFGDIPFNSTYDDRVIRGSTGFSGDLDGFHYSASVTIAHNSLDTTLNGYVNYDNLISDINTGAYSFVNPASNSAAVLAALAPALAKTSVSDLDSFDINISRDLYQLPGGPLQFAVGGQLRYERIDDPGLNTFNADGSPTPTSVLGLGIAETSGHRYVGAAFFELDAPVTKQVDLNVSGRYDHYSDFGGTFNPQVGLKVSPIRQVTFRATYGTGFRAPSFSQNGSSQSEGFITYVPPASFAALHNNDPYVQQYTLAEFSTSNPAIQPETSESFTLGMILKPDPHLNLSLDYYHIRQSGIIAQSDPSAVPA